MARKDLAPTAAVAMSAGLFGVGFSSRLSIDLICGGSLRPLGGLTVKHGTSVQVARPGTGLLNGAGTDPRLCSRDAHYRRLPQLASNS